MPLSIRPLVLCAAFLTSLPACTAPTAESDATMCASPGALPQCTNAGPGAATDNSSPNDPAVSPAMASSHPTAVSPATAPSISLPMPSEETPQPSIPEPLPQPSAQNPTGPGREDASVAGETQFDAGAGQFTTVDEDDAALATGSPGDDAGDREVPTDDGCDIGLYDGTSPQVLTLSGNTFAHDPTMIEANGVFYRFWTGDNIPVATSTDLRNWQNAPAVYRDGYPSWVNDWRGENPGNTFNFPWAPDVSFFGGRYHLYSSFSAFFGRNISCITHLTTDSPASGDWTDHGPVICTDGQQDYNAIDADVAVDADGTPWLSFGSFWNGIYAFQLNESGDRVGTDLHHLAWAREIEAPVLFYRCGYYYLFVTWGLCCPGEGRSIDDLSYRVVVGRSEHIMGPYVDRDGVPLTDGGGSPVVAGDGVQFAAAGHSDVIVSDGVIYHLYHAYRQSNGNAELRIAELPFDAEGWPVGSGP